MEYILSHSGPMFRASWPMRIGARRSVITLACTAGAAGAVLDPESLVRAYAAGLDPVALLEAHASRDFFATTGGLVVTGPTRTNVNDFRAILIGASAGAHMPL